MKTEKDIWLCHHIKSMDLKTRLKTYSRMSSRDQYRAIKNITVYPWERRISYVSSVHLPLGLLRWPLHWLLSLCCCPFPVLPLESFAFRIICFEMQTSFVTYLVKILKWFTMVFKITCKFPSLAHQDHDALTLAGVFCFSFSLSPTGILTLDHTPYLWVPNWASSYIPFCLCTCSLLHSQDCQGSVQILYPARVPHDSPAWTFDTLHCIFIASLCVLLGSTRTGTVTLFSLSCVSNTCSSAWHKRVLRIDVWTKLGKAGC